MSEQQKGAASGALQGAASGATTGAAFGGWIGAIVGGVVGGIAGAFGGAKGGKYGDIAKQKQQLAQLTQFEREEEAYRQQYLSVLRQGRIQRASSLAAAVAMGSEQGSGSAGALGSIGSQIANQVEYMSVDRAREILASYLQGEAQRYSQKSADTMGMVSTASTIVGAIGTAYSLGSSMAASSAAAEASKAGVGGVAQASGVGSSAATQTASSIAGNVGAKQLLTPIGTMASTNNTGYFSAEIWNQASQQLMNRAMLQNSLVNASIQTSRAYYSGTRFVRA